MNNKYNLLNSLLFFGVFNMPLFSQKIIPASGGNASGENGSLSYSVGQITASNVSGSSGFIFSGVQIPYEITVLVGIDDLRFTLQCEIYPNPSTDFLKLKVDELAIQNPNATIYQLCDLTGKILESYRITSNETKIVIGRYKAGSYLLRLIQENKVIKSFKIIKE